ncbi:hypothetical protein HDV03_004856 [Kappamyces sp. JEL0829]|nr:hypothetical protein HDV03_004856 [Kappamyces sp. JEL0829]
MSFLATLCGIPQLRSAADSAPGHEMHRVFAIAEILEKIIGFLDQPELSRASQVSKTWYSVATPLLYRHICFHGDHDAGRIGPFLVAVHPQGTSRSLLDTTRDCMEKAMLVVSRVASYIHAEGLPGMVDKNARDSIVAWTSQLYQRVTWRRPRCPSCQRCSHARSLADRSPRKALLIPHTLGRHTHRFKGAIYGVVPLKSTQKLVDQPALRDRGDFAACIQFHMHPSVLKWTPTKSFLYQSHGPFLRSFCVSDMNVSDEILTAIVSKLSHLRYFSVTACPLVTDKTVRTVCMQSRTNLLHLTLSCLPRLTDAALYDIATHCPNLEGLDLQNSYQISEVGVRHVLFSCPFLCMLDLQRLGNGISLGYGYAMNERVIPYLLAYGVSLRYLCLAGCQLKTQDVQKLISGTPNITTWGVGFLQVGTRNVPLMKQIVGSWFGAKCVSCEPLEDYAITLVLDNGKKVHVIGTRLERVARYFTGPT